MLLNKADVVSGFDGELPYGCTAHTRTDGEQVYVFLENYSQETKTLVTKNFWLDIESETVYKDSIILGKFETKIVRKIKGEV
jgi:beta-galactosidase